METIANPNAEQQAAPNSKLHWYRLTPDRIILALLILEVLLWLSERFDWFGFKHHKNWTVLIGVAAVGAVILLMLLWLTASLILRWRFQFSVRSLLVLTVAVAIPSSWAVKIQEANRQRAATDAIMKLGGRVEYDYQIDLPVQPPPNAQPPGPAWLRNLLGRDFFDRVTVVDLAGDDAELEALQGLPNLLGVCTNGWGANYYLSSKITNAGLVHIEPLQRLDTLAVCGPNITDDGLTHLEGLHELDDLELAGERITNAGLVHLQSLHKLTKLTLCCNISDEGMKLLMPLTNLTNLSSRGLPNDSVKNKIYNALREPTQLEFVDTPLVDVCDYLQDFHHIKFQIDQTALKEAKMLGFRELTCTIRGVPLRTALNSLLDLVGLAWHVGPGGVVITTKAAYAKRHVNLLRLQQALPNLKQVEVDW